MYLEMGPLRKQLRLNKVIRVGLVLPLLPLSPSTLLPVSLLLAPFLPLFSLCLPHFSIPPAPSTPYTWKKDKPGREALAWTELVRTLVLDFQAPELWENECCLSHPVCGVNICFGSLSKQIHPPIDSWEYFLLLRTRQVSFCRKRWGGKAGAWDLSGKAGQWEATEGASYPEGTELPREKALMQASLSLFTVLLVDSPGKRQYRSHNNWSVNLWISMQFPWDIEFFSPPPADNLFTICTEWLMYPITLLVLLV